MPRPGFGRANLPGQPQELRQRQTSAEELAWEMLRSRKLAGLKFRRQFPIAIYITDFCCYERRLVVELDGGVHAEPEQILHDRNRDAYLRASGYRVLRFANREVFEEPREVLRRIAEAAGVGSLGADGLTGLSPDGLTPDGLTPDPSPIALPPNRERGAPALLEAERQPTAAESPETDDNTRSRVPPSPGGREGDGRGGPGG